MASPLVSVVSAYYNRQDHVEASIRSLLEQTYDNLEIIVVDDGSTDQTYARLCAFSDPRLRVIKQENSGFVSAIRCAIDHAKGTLIAVHGSGDISLPQRTEKQVALLQARPEVGVVGCYIDNINTYNGTRFVYKPSLPENMTERLERGSVFTHGEVMYRRELYERVGGYRAFFKYAQDRDLWLRLSLHTRFAVVEEILYERLQLLDGIELNPTKRALQAYFADFAVQCLNSRDEGGRDLVERYGDHAAFFRKRSPEVAKKLQLFSNYALLRKEVLLAHHLNRLSVREKRGVKNTLAQGLLELASSSRMITTVLLYLLLKARAVKRFTLSAGHTDAQPN